MRITIKDIAHELGISHSTVSRVLNEKQSNLVSDATRVRIIDAAHRMGYRPSRIAQALQGKSTQLIGVMVPDTEDFFFQTVLKHLRRTLEASDYELMVFASAGDQIAARWHRLLQWDLDGVFVFDYLFYVDGLWEAMTTHTGAIPPVVGLFSNQTQLKDYATVNFAPAVESLLQHLAAQGCRRLGYLAHPGSLQAGEQRYDAFSEFVQRSGLEQVDIPAPLLDASLMEQARTGMREWLGTGVRPPDALFCQNDELALGAYKALKEAGIRVPIDVALAGCDNLPYMSYIETPLTTISLPVQEVCSAGWSILLDRMADPSGPPRQAVLDAVLLLRESCQRPHLAGAPRPAS